MLISLIESRFDPSQMVDDALAWATSTARWLKDRGAIAIASWIDQPILVAPASRPIACRSPEAILSQESQWERLSTTISTATRGAEAMKFCHETAAEKLDAAAYSLADLIKELTAVMPAERIVAGAPVIASIGSAAARPKRSRKARARAA